MAVTLDSKMPTEVQEHAKSIVQRFMLDDFKVYYKADEKLIIFEKDRRVVSVPLTLMETNNWQDISFLFRAILGSANSLWNTASDDNDWSGKNHYDN